MKTFLRNGLVLASLAALGAACGDRDPVWDEAVGGPIEALGLEASVAVVDRGAERLLMLPVEADQTLAPTSIALPEGFASAAATRDRKRLLALSRGVVPRRRADEAGPAAVVVSGGPQPAIENTFELSDPLSGVALDPESRFAVLYPTANDSPFLENPNELVLLDLTRGPAADNPTPRTLRSFGGTPERFLFTPTLELPGGETRLLVVGTDRDVSILDLGRLSQPEITVRLTGGTTSVRPAGLVVSDGEVGKDDDARIAVRVEGDANVYLVDLSPVPPEDAAGAAQPYRAVPNVVFVGGTPSDLAFVRTDGGLRLAAVVPAKSALTLVDPVTGMATDVPLGAPYTRISLVTEVVGEGEDGSDVALLWSDQRSSLAFVALGATVGKPYKSVETLVLPAPVSEVIDVPAPNRHLKVLGSPQRTSFTVLDLAARTAAPLAAAATDTEVRVAPDGRRAWFYSRGYGQLAVTDLATLHPKNFVLSHPIADVFDLARRDGGRALVALHAIGAGAATVLDAQSPSLTTAREVAGLLQGGLP
jgi:hypothetical protein